MSDKTLGHRRGTIGEVDGNLCCVRRFLEASDGAGVNVKMGRDVGCGDLGGESGCDLGRAVRIDGHFSGSDLEGVTSEVQRGHGVGQIANGKDAGGGGLTLFVAVAEETVESRRVSKGLGKGKVRRAVRKLIEKLLWTCRFTC